MINSRPEPRGCRCRSCCCWRCRCCRYRSRRCWCCSGKRSKRWNRGSCFPLILFVAVNDSRGPLIFYQSVHSCFGVHHAFSFMSILINSFVYSVQAVRDLILYAMRVVICRLRVFFHHGLLLLYDVVFVAESEVSLVYGKFADEVIYSVESCV